MLTNFVGDIKQQMFYQLRKVTLEELIILSSKTIYMVWSPGAVSMTFHNVIVFQCYSLYFDTLLARYTEVKNQLKQFFFKDIKYDELLSKM